MKPLIMKFGGTSLGSKERIQSVARLIHERANQHPVVVTSAMSQITNLLIETANAAQGRKSDLVQKNMNLIRDKHLSVASTPKIRTELEKLLAELEKKIGEIHRKGRLSAKTLDLVSSFGERLSSWLVTEALQALGLEAERFDSRELVRTNDQFGEAEVDWKITQGQIQKTVNPALDQGILAVITGFIGATERGETTTLGRGGSDYSASIFGVSLDANEIQIWTDVDGMMTADPRVVPNAQSIEKISFREAAELAYFGAKVLHPKTIQPAVEANIPVRVLNTLNPSNPGTTILHTDEISTNSIKAIAFKKGISIINITSTRMFGPYGFLARIFNVFEQQKISVDVIATSEVSVSVTIEDGFFKQALIDELSKFAKVSVTPHQTIICVVGNGLKDDYRVEQQIFNTLAKEKIGTELISKGASQINLTFLIKTEHVERAVVGLHNTFFFRRS